MRFVTTTQLRKPLRCYKTKKQGKKETYPKKRWDILLEKFSIEFLKWSWVHLVLSCFALWLRHILNQSNAELKQIASWSLAFPALQAGCPLLAEFSLVKDDVTFVLIGNCDNFGFGV